MFYCYLKITILIRDNLGNDQTNNISYNRSLYIGVNHGILLLTAR